MNHSIPDAATATVTDPRQENPRPLYERLVVALRTRGRAARGVFFASHRELARELGCSAGALPPLMERAVADGVITRKRYLKTYRLTLIDHGRAFGQQPDMAAIDHASQAALADAATASVSTAPIADSASGRPRAGVIDRDPAHVEDHDSSRVVGDARARGSTEDDHARLWAEGFNPVTIPELLASQIPVAQICGLLAIKRAQRARNPEGIVVTWVRHAVATGLPLTARAQEVGGERGAHAGAGAGRPTTHQRGRSGGRAGPPPRAHAPQPAVDAHALAQRPRLRLQL